MSLWAQGVRGRPGSGAAPFLSARLLLRGSLLPPSAAGSLQDCCGCDSAGVYPVWALRWALALEAASVLPRAPGDRCSHGPHPQMRKLRPREAEWLGQGPAAAGWRGAASLLPTLVTAACVGRCFPGVAHFTPSPVGKMLCYYAVQVASHRGEGGSPGCRARKWGPRIHAEPSSSSASLHTCVHLPAQALWGPSQDRAQRTRRA